MPGLTGEISGGITHFSCSNPGCQFPFHISIMLKKKYFILTACFCFSILSIGLLDILSRNLDSQKNGFTRVLSPNLVRGYKSLDLDYNSFYIAGVTASHIYLGNFVVPTHLVVTDYSLAFTKTLDLVFHDQDTIAWNAVTLRIDSPDIYLMENTSPAILHGKLGTEQTTFYKPAAKLVSAILPISPVSFILRTYDRKLHQNILVKETTDQSSIHRPTTVLEKQLDGFFCVDGRMHYSRDLALLIYVYQYRNQYVCMDTNLNILFKGKTIDTTSRVKIKIASISSEKMNTLATPPLNVNEKSCISGGRLFIHSALSADNEDRKKLEHKSVIDVYSLNSTNYQFSFYLDDFKKNKFSNFSLMGNNLIAIYDHYLLVYTLNF
jgi:hypothetical protein